MPIKRPWHTDSEFLEWAIEESAAGAPQSFLRAYLSYRSGEIEADALTEAFKNLDCVGTKPRPKREATR